ncbi:MAG: hypothetical protein NVS1B4_13660 [Gemmatimonadaceae bacterium]
MPAAIQGRELPLWLFGGLLAAGDYANYRWRIDPDPGGYKPAWNDRALYPKEFVHGITGFGLGALADLAGVPTKYRVPGICLAAYGYELSQGFVNRLDLISGCSGAAAEAMWHAMWNRWRGD